MHSVWGPIFDVASPQASKVASLFETALVICAAIFAVVASAVIYNILRFRANGDDAEPRQIRGRRDLEILWTAIPGAIVVALLIMTANVMSSTVPRTDPKPDLIVTARQWWWEARYQDSGADAANEIHIPVGKRLLVELLSPDVIHDFWAPSLGPKMDIIPGHPNWIWLEADSPGTYMGACAEFCGAQHAWMRFVVIAQPAAEFETWERRQLQPAENSEAVAAGRRVFQQQVCGNCHSVIGLSTNGTAGPDLTHLGGRQTLAGGVLVNNVDNTARWLENPQAFKPGCLMPNFNLTYEQAHQLAAFLEASP